MTDSLFGRIREQAEERDGARCPECDRKVRGSLYSLGGGFRCQECLAKSQEGQWLARRLRSLESRR